MSLWQSATADMTKNTVRNLIKHIIKKRFSRLERMMRGVVGKESLERRDEMKRLLVFTTALFTGIFATGWAMAAEGAAAGADSKGAAIAIAAGIAVAIAAFGAAFGQGRVGAAAMESIGRNPNAADRLFLPLVLTLALLEALALYGFVIAIILSGQI